LARRAFEVSWSYVLSSDFLDSIACTVSTSALWALSCLIWFTPGLILLDSVHYLPLAEATVFRFLVPIVTAWACSIFLGQIFSKKDLAAGLVALIGVTIIAHPAAIFGNEIDSKTTSNKIDKVTPAQRLIAIGVSVVGVLGASGAYTMIRVIGSRAHALMSVNYFAFVSTVGSTAILLITPGIGFVMPENSHEWLLLALLGVLGFVLQFLLTAGLQMDKSSKATSMLYTQILFALLFDWTIWGVLPGTWSLIGGAIVIASTLWSALQRPQKPAKKISMTTAIDEESALLGAENIEGGADRRASTST
jgi:drug/metabolite transporter (DMT)-like permease